MNKTQLNLKGEDLYLNNTRPAGTALHFLELDDLNTKEINAIYLNYLNVLLLGNEILKLKKMNQLLPEELVFDFIKQAFCIPFDVVNELERKKEYKTLLENELDQHEKENIITKTIEKLLGNNASKAYLLNYNFATNEYLKMLIFKSNVERFNKILESTFHMFLNFEEKLNNIGKTFDFYDNFTTNIDNVCDYYFIENKKSNKEKESLKILYCLFNDKINNLASKNFFINQFSLLGIDKFDFGLLNIETKSFKKNKSLSFNFNVFFDENYNFNHQLSESFSQFDLKNKKTLIDHYLNEYTIKDENIDQHYLTNIKNQILIDYENNKPVLIYSKQGVGKKSFIHYAFKNIDKKIYFISATDTLNLISKDDFLEILMISNQKNDHIFIFDDIYYQNFKDLIALFVNNFHIITTNNAQNKMMLSKDFSFYNINAIPTYVKLETLKKLIFIDVEENKLKEISIMVKNFNQIKKISEKINNHEITVEKTISNLKTNNSILNLKNDHEYFYYSEDQKQKINKIENLFNLKQKSESEKIRQIPKGFIFFGEKGNGKNSLLNEVSYKLNIPLIRFDLSKIKELDTLIFIKNEILDHAPSIVVFDGYIPIDELNITLQKFNELDIDRSDSVFILNTYYETDFLGKYLLKEFKNIENYPQRFYFDYLSLSERKIFLQELLKDLLNKNDTDLLSEITERVEIKELVNFASTLKYHKETEQKEITLHDAREILDNLLIGEETTDLYLPSNKQEKEESQYKTAIHEMGHALLGLKYKMDLASISIVSRSYYLGVTRFNIKEFGYKTTLSALKQDIEVTLGGLIAEQLFFNEHELGVSNDMKMVNQTLEQIFRIGQSDVNLETGDIFVFNTDPKMLPLLSEKDKDEISNRKRKILKDCLLSATAFLKENKELLEKTAILLKDKRCLYKEDIDKIKEEILNL